MRAPYGLLKHRKSFLARHSPVKDGAFTLFISFISFFFSSEEEEYEHKGIIYEELLVVVTWKLFFISMFLLYQFVSFN